MSSETREEDGSVEMDEFERLNQQFGEQIATIMDAHQWHHTVHGCECGRQVVDWWDWRRHVATLLAFVPLEVWADQDSE